MLNDKSNADLSWLIERNSMWGCEWFCGGKERFTKEAHKAIRFPDAESAAEIHSKLRGKVEVFTYPLVEDGASGEWEYTYTITEHMFNCGIDQAKASNVADPILTRLDLIGEMREDGLHWHDQNPHAHPVGTKFYANIGELTSPEYISRLRGVMGPEVDEEPREVLAKRLIDAWCADKGRQIPWAKVIQIVAIVTKQPDAERDELLRLGDENGECGMCGRSDASPVAGEVKG